VKVAQQAEETQWVRSSFKAWQYDTTHGTQKKTQDKWILIKSHKAFRLSSQR